MNNPQHPLQARSSLTARRGTSLSLRLLFALLVGTALIVTSAHPAGATTIINGLEFGLSQCPSSTITTGSDRDAGFFLPSSTPDYASAFAQWVVPTVTPTSDDRTAAFWVGITDNNPGKIVQAGVQTASIKGQPEYNAWWEDFPTAPTSIPLNSSTYPVRPGDTMKVTVTRTDTSDANWKITIINQTRNWTFTQPISGFTDYGSPQYEEEIPPPPTPQISPQTSVIQVLESGYTLFGNSNPQYVSEQKGGCAINGDPVVNAYTSPTTNSVGAFTITTAPSAPPYPYTDYGPGVGCCFSFWGTWYQRFTDGGEEGQSIATLTGGGQTTAEAAWQPFLSAYSWYQVLAFIPPHPGSSLGWAHYYFTDNNHAYTQVGVSQAGNYGQWLNLGNWQADGNGHITVKLHNDVNQPGYYLEADAMRFVSVPTSYPLNTYGPGSGCCFSTTGTWYSGAGHGLIGQEIWTWSNGSTGSATANWSPKLNQGATYDIKVYIPNYAANGYVHYYITDDTGTTMVPVNQANYGNVWVDLGHFVADSSTGFITVSLHNDDDAYHTRYVGADAASFTPVKTCITPPCPSTPGTVVVNG